MSNSGDLEIEKEEQGTGAANYGKYFWGVELLNKTVVLFFADQVTIEPSGTLCAYQKRDEGLQVTLAWLPSQWGHFWAASGPDGRPVAVDSVIDPSEKASKKKGARAK